MEDIKQDITDNQYKIIMDSWMKIRNGRNWSRNWNKCVYKESNEEEIQYYILRDPKNEIMTVYQDKNFCFK